MLPMKLVEQIAILVCKIMNRGCTFVGLPPNMCPIINSLRHLCTYHGLGRLCQDSYQRYNVNYIDVQEDR